jgi:predicted RND superfamily exporter protein
MTIATEYSFTDRIALRFADIAIRSPWKMIALAMLVAIVTASGAVNLGLSSNYRVFFSSDNPELLAFENFQDTYTKNDNIFFYVQPATDAVFSSSVADAIETLTEKAWQIPYVIRVDSISNFQHSWAEGDDLTVEDLIRGGRDLSQSDMKEKQAIAVNEPLLYGNVLSRDLVGTAVNVVLQYPELSESEVPEAVAVARQIEAEIESQYPDLTVALTGVSMLNNAFAESGQIDAGTLIPAMYVLLMIVTLLVLRSFIGMAVTFALIVMSTVSAMGIAGHFHVMLDPISLTAPIVIMTLAVADSIHILVTMLNQMRRGKGKLEALRESMRINFLAVGITSITTMIGFLSLNYSDSPPFNYLGNITAVGILMAWIYSVTFLPAVLRLIPVKVRVSEDGQTRGDVLYDKLSTFITRKYRAILLVGSVVAIGSIAVIPKVDFNDQWVEYFNNRVTFRTDTDYAVEHLPAIYPMEFSVGSEGPNGINDPEYLLHLERFTEWLKTQANVEHVYSYTDIIKRLNKNMHGDDDAYYRIPEEQELSAQYLFLYEISLPFGLDLNDRINVDKSATRVTATLSNVSTLETREFIEDSENWLRLNTPEYMWTQPTSANVMFSFISKRNIESMLIGNGMAVILIAIIMMVALRNVQLGTLSLIPNVLPILITYGVWTILVGRIGMASATVSATSLGIIVDDSVHFLTKYLRARREYGYERPDAIRYVFHNVGNALISNSIILIFGFAFLALSTFKVNLEMGLLTAIAILVAFIFDFLVLPALLLVGHQSTNKGENYNEITHDNKYALQAVD